MLSWVIIGGIEGAGVKKMLPPYTAGIQEDGQTALSQVLSERSL